jgi:uracil-DNA glycosylase
VPDIFQTVKQGSGMSWEQKLKIEYEQVYFKRLKAFLNEESRAGHTIYPAKDNILNAFRLTEFEDTKVVILGQDPYHGPRQAHGLAFSVQQGVPIPPSLRNIFQELKDDLGIEPPKHGDLTAWAKQGVLLLNTVLTVRAGLAQSHAEKGWEAFTDKAIRLLNDEAPGPVIFLLWGAPANRKAKLINNQQHTILSAPHPSPLSSYRGFFGCKHFSKVNEILRRRGEREIDWRL